MKAAKAQTLGCRVIGKKKQINGKAQKDTESRTVSYLKPLFFFFFFFVFDKESRLKCFARSFVLS
jgi:hypothetical protein